MLLHPPSGLYASHKDEVPLMEILPDVMIPVIGRVIHLVHKLVSQAIGFRSVASGETGPRVDGTRHARDGTGLEVTTNIVAVTFISRHREGGC